MVKIILKLKFYKSESCKGETGTDCLTCASSDHRTIESSTGKCLCDEEYYDDGSYNVC